VRTGNCAAVNVVVVAVVDRKNGQRSEENRDGWMIVGVRGVSGRSDGGGMMPVVHRDPRTLLGDDRNKAPKLAHMRTTQKKTAGSLFPSVRCESTDCSSDSR
jgi:hypothetical protein